MKDDKWKVLRDVFSPKKDQVIVEPDYSFSEIAAMSWQNSGDPLGLSRWCDYEEMDEYPDIKSPYYFANDAVTIDTETTGGDVVDAVAFMVPYFKQTGTFTGRVSSSDPNGNKSNQPREKYDVEKELAKLTPEEQAMVRGIVAEYNKHTHKVESGCVEPHIAKFVPTKENCGCSGYDLFHTGHKCGFFKN